MAGAGNIYRIQNFFNIPGGQQAVVTQYYRVTAGGTGSAANVNGGWESKFESSVLNLLNEDSVLIGRVIINGMNISDFVDLVPNDSGTKTGASLPPALTPVFRSARDQPGDHYSYQRWPFGSVSDLGDGGLWTSAFQTALASFTDLLEDTLTLGSGDVLEPCQITGPFLLSTPPTFARALTLQWAYGPQPHWLESRQPAFTYTST